MNKNNYTKAYSEVVEILKYLPEESVNKIPKEMLEMFKTKMDKNYTFEIDVNKSFDEQNLLEETKAIFANIFRDYWATPYKKDKIVAKENYNRQKLEAEKRERYNPDDLFKKKEVKHNYVEKENILPVEVKKEKIYQKLINFTKKFLHL